MVAICAVDVIVGTYYRFTTTSKMWLDEAQTVNIASFPIRSIAGELRLDGAPPLYYYLLHLWMGVFGTSDASIRAMSGLFGVLALPLMWWVVRRGFGRIEAIAALAVLASSPFAVYFATEARMYSLIVLLVVAGIGAVQALLSRPTVPRAVLLALVTALLLYTHYWSLYLFVVVGAWLSVVALRGRGERRRGGVYGLAALALGAVAWLPWVPTFLSQRAHTGTPWSSAPTLAAAFGWFASFVENESVQGETLSLHLELALLCFVVLLVFGFAGTPAGSQPSGPAPDGPAACARARRGRDRHARGRMGREPRGRYGVPAALLVGRVPGPRHPRRARDRGAADALAPSRRARSCERPRAVDDALGRPRPAHPSRQGCRRPARRWCRPARSSSSAPISSAPRCCATPGRPTTTTAATRGSRTRRSSTGATTRPPSPRRLRRPSPSASPHSPVTNRSTSSGPSATACTTRAPSFAAR